MTRGSRGLALLGGLLGLSGVVMAALGSHVVADTGVPGPDRYRSWQAANLLHLLHAVTLLSLAALARETGRQLVQLQRFVRDPHRCRARHRRIRRPCHCLQTPAYW